MSKKRDKPSKKRRRDRAAILNEGDLNMVPDDFRPEGNPDPHGAAAIPPVTEAAMDRAAHAAAELADAVAHGTAQAPRAAADLIDRTSAVSADMASQASDAMAQVAVVQGEAADSVQSLVRHAADTVATAAGRAGAVAEDVAKASEAGLSNSVDALGRYNAKLFEAMHSNMAAAGAHAAALAQAKSLSEAMAINADHVRRSVEAMTTQGRELTVLAQRVLFGALQPLKDVIPHR